MSEWVSVCVYNVCIHAHTCIKNTYYTRVYPDTHTLRRRERVKEKVSVRERQRERLDTDTRCFVVGWWERETN